MKFDMDKFFAGVREWLGSLSQDLVDGINALLAGIEADPEMTDPRWVSYALATAYHETDHTCLPVEEIGKGHRRPYGDPDPETGQIYYGRGLVQLTWKKNYQEMGELLGQDLVNHPELALEPATAYRIMSEGMRKGLFTGKRLSDYISGDKCDYINARRIINGLDKAALIAGYAKRFEAILAESQEEQSDAQQ